MHLMQYFNTNHILLFSSSINPEMYNYHVVLNTLFELFLDEGAKIILCPPYES